MHATDPNVGMFEAVLERLGAIAEEMVFVGGCAAGLLITDQAAPALRPTQDVDAIVEVVSLRQYHQLASRLRSHGFREDDADDGHIARWCADRLVLDVMPTDAAVLGFGNRWYTTAFHGARRVTLPSGREARLVSAPAFIATKLAAFEDRGNGDYAASHDLEDVIAVVDGRPEIVEDIRQADAALREHLARSLSGLLEQLAFRQALPGFLPPDSAAQGRRDLIESRLQEAATLDA